MRGIVAALVAVLMLAPAVADAAGSAKAELKNAEGKTVGDATLEQTPNGVLIRASFRDLPPGEHAFHIHEVGRCERPDFKSAGGHYAPGGGQHGFKDAKGPHAGDLPNIHVPDSGAVRVEILAPHVSVGSGKANVLDGNGAALVVHAKPDDYATNPAGAAGDRIACGEIKG